ncbi:MAG: hypothetical protein ACETVY_05625 [Candidatus Bathyarchaeia archaeon]
MSRDLTYAKLSDEQVMTETQNRLREMKSLLIEIRDALKSASGLE